MSGFGQCLMCGNSVTRVGWDDYCDSCEDELNPPNCPGMGIDDLCTWPDAEGCGLCIIGKNPAIFAPATGDANSQARPQPPASRP